MGRFVGAGLGVTHSAPPVTVKLPPDLDAVARAAGDRSAALRRWIAVGMLAEGLISQEIAEKYLAVESTMGHEQESKAPAKPRRRGSNRAQP